MTYRKGVRTFAAMLALVAIAPVVAQTQTPEMPSQLEQAPNLPAEPDPDNIIIGPAPPTVTEIPVLPVPAPPPQPVKKKGPADLLRPGQFVWEQRDSYSGPLKIVIVLDIQRLYVFDNDTLIGFSTISTGKKGKETPTGNYNILQKNIDHKSNIYSNAPMPFMQRLTWDGIALHAGKNPGYPASHGCIRLPLVFAKALYAVTQLDDRVVVLQDTSKPAPKPEPPDTEPPTSEPALPFPPTPVEEILPPARAS